MPVPQVPSANPAQDAALVTPNDAADLPVACNALWVGAAGNVRLTTPGGSDVVFTNVPAGFVLPVGAKRVWATNTTATGIVALY